jgi:hypothetical protein
MTNVDKLNGDELFPYMKNQNITKRFGFALTRPGAEDKHGGGSYTLDLEEVIRRVVIDGWNVRVKTINRIGKQRQGTFGIGKTAKLDYWVSPELLDLIKTAPIQPKNVLPSEKSTRPGLNIVTPSTVLNSLPDEQSERIYEVDVDCTNSFEYPIEDIQQRAIKTRRGQPDFRKRLLDAYGNKCAVTGCQVHSVLEAAHIIPHAEGTDYEVGNGLPLRADIHTLFDLRLLAVSSDYRIHISSQLADSEYKNLHEQAINLPRNKSDYPSPEKLAKHFEAFDKYKEI